MPNNEDNVPSSEAVLVTLIVFGFLASGIFTIFVAVKIYLIKFYF
jgi:uncharacterized membrane protein HdeD (DUF308 family)